VADGLAAAFNPACACAPALDGLTASAAATAAATSAARAMNCQPLAKLLCVFITHTSANVT
jgi:hypothetical protein